MVVAVTVVAVGIIFMVAADLVFVIIAVAGVAGIVAVVIVDIVAVFRVVVVVTCIGDDDNDDENDDDNDGDVEDDVDMYVYDKLGEGRCKCRYEGKALPWRSGREGRDGR